MKKLWSDENRFNLWFRVELAAMRAMEKHGVVPEGSAAKLKRRVKRIDPARIDELEATARHDIIAFLSHIEEMAGEPGRFMHFGMTSSDVLDTTFALQLTAATDLITQELNLLLKALKKRAFEHRATPMVGRTHGIHAQPWDSFSRSGTVKWKETWRASGRPARRSNAASFPAPWALTGTSRLKSRRLP